MLSAAQQMCGCGRVAGAVLPQPAASARPNAWLQTLCFQRIKSATGEPFRTAAIRNGCCLGGYVMWHWPRRQPSLHDGKGDTMLTELELAEYREEIRNHVCSRCVDRPAGGPPCEPLGKRCGVE